MPSINAPQALPGSPVPQQETTDTGENNDKGPGIQQATERTPEPQQEAPGTSKIEPSDRGISQNNRRTLEPQPEATNRPETPGEDGIETSDPQEFQKLNLNPKINQPKI